VDNSPEVTSNEISCAELDDSLLFALILTNFKKLLVATWALSNRYGCGLIGFSIKGNFWKVFSDSNF
jgi:hypothetical protein